MILILIETFGRRNRKEEEREGGIKIRGKDVPRGKEKNATKGS